MEAALIVLYLRIGRTHMHYPDRAQYVDNNYRNMLLLNEDKGRNELVQDVFALAFYCNFLYFLMLYSQCRQDDKTN
jgi:hypothetical protein